MPANFKLNQNPISQPVPPDYCRNKDYFMESRKNTRQQFKAILISTLIIAMLITYPILPAHAQTQPVVNAILFYSPACGHCHYVITEVLPPLFEQYPDQLMIIGIDVTQEAGRDLYISTLQYFSLSSSGVPLLVLGDKYLMGDVDIPEQLPGLIEQYLAQGGLDWPPIPGLKEILAKAQTASQPTAEPTATAQPTLVTTLSAGMVVTTPSPQPIMTPTPAISGIVLASNSDLNLMDRLSQDPVGNGVAILVLGGMLLAVIGGLIYFHRSIVESGQILTGWLFPVLCIEGMLVAFYLSYVEITQIEAVCGPVGDCNTVQQSEYARLFGVLPIGVLGLVGYATILIAWLVSRFGKRRIAIYASLLILGMSAIGMLFSIYLTFLEPFVIGATCAWCLASAIIMTALFWLSLLPGKSGLTILIHGEKNVNRRKNSRRAFKSL
jgi:uncharacterized membrane protein/thiol-disulfide isomerase/thioredoxin